MLWLLRLLTVATRVLWCAALLRCTALLRVTLLRVALLRLLGIRTTLLRLLRVPALLRVTLWSVRSPSSSRRKWRLVHRLASVASAMQRSSILGGDSLVESDTTLALQSVCASERDALERATT